jgi:hypothetical protein
MLVGSYNKNVMLPIFQDQFKRVFTSKDFASVDFTSPAKAEFVRSAAITAQVVRKVLTKFSVIFILNPDPSLELRQYLAKP